MINETQHSEPALAIVAPLIFGNQPPRVQKDTQGILEVDAMLCEVARSFRRIPFELHAQTTGFPYRGSTHFCKKVPVIGDAVEQSLAAHGGSPEREWSPQITAWHAADASFCAASRSWPVAAPTPDRRRAAWGDHAQASSSRSSTMP